MTRRAVVLVLCYTRKEVYQQGLCQFAAGRELCEKILGGSALVQPPEMAGDSMLCGCHSEPLVALDRSSRARRRMGFDPILSTALSLQNLLGSHFHGNLVALINRGAPKNVVSPGSGDVKPRMCLYVIPLYPQNTEA